MGANVSRIEVKNIRFHEKIGEGGYGTVKRVTFKKPFKGYKEAAAKIVFEIAEQEVKVMSQLDHKHIIILLGVCHNEIGDLIIMEYAPNGSLHDYLKDKFKPLPHALQKKWAKEAAFAIQYLHGLNFLHRDIKPQNCLLFDENLLKLCDFGLAREIEASQTTSSQKGTHRYMAPELHRGNKQGRAVFSKPSDIYAYGMLVLEMCTRKQPFEELEWHRIIFEVGRGAKPNIPDDCPKDLSYVVKLCYNTDPKERATIGFIVDDEPPIGENREYPRPNTREEIYDQVAKSKPITKLDRRHLETAERVGIGEFGPVLKGTYIMQGRVIPVAVTTRTKSDIIEEAEIMAGLDHPHIVRMIGKFCDMSIRNVLELMLQVAKGMQYLEEVANCVHRDLAARNVLLVDETFAKITDFKMSKALGLDGEYYPTDIAGKWPLKWYAPECIYRFRFSSKSDVWSYGVTLWEALSYGKKPYPNMKGQELMQYIENDQRLHKPEMCPKEAYDLMRSCWLFNSQDRPSFREIVRQMTDIINKLRSG